MNPTASRRNHQADRSIGKPVNREEGLDDLDGQPRRHHVSRGYAQDIAALQFD